MTELEAEKGYSGWERFLFFVVPILFTVLLLGALVIVFNDDLRNKMLAMGNDIPLVGSLLPSPPLSEADKEKAAAETAQAEDETVDRVSELEALLLSKEAELTETAASAARAEELAGNLQREIDQLKRVNEEQQLDDEAYNSNIKSLAGMYAQMAPNKAAPILESMTMEETVLILGAMRPEDRVRIMERMTPRAAADATAMMKDAVPAKDQQIAALQARLEKQQSETALPATQLDEAQLSATFSTMDPARAAELLLKMADLSPSKVLRILNAVNSGARSAIVAEMSSQNKEITAQLVAKLMPG
ncbi:MotE family protein [Paenibacillus sp. 1P07SE]|uniref:MotE family protein n=1 Tax=Paenibacillus sp. 1P07SE TaxID=3132209 RepID=UPI0039A744F0